MFISSHFVRENNYRWLSEMDISRVGDSRNSRCFGLKAKILLKYFYCHSFCIKTSFWNTWYCLNNFFFYLFRLDLLPFYSRLVATLSPCLAEIAPDLVYLLKGSFLSHVKYSLACVLLYILYLFYYIELFETTWKLGKGGGVRKIDGILFYSMNSAKTCK